MLSERDLIPATCESGRRIRGDPLLSHRLGEIFAPVAPHVLVDVQPASVLAFGFDDQVDMGVFLVGVEHHCVPVLEGELLEREFPSGGQDFVWERGEGIERTMLWMSFVRRAVVRLE